MSGGSPDNPLEASERRLEEARKKGDLPRSAEFIGAVGFLAVVALLGLSAREVFGRLAEMQECLLIELPKSARAGTIGLEAGWICEPMGTVVPALMAVAAAATVAFGFGLWVNRFNFVLEQLSFKPNRISLLQNLKSKFGSSGLASFSMSLLKITLVLGAGLFFIYADRGLYIAEWTSPRRAVEIWAGRVWQFLAGAVALLLILGFADFLIQRSIYQRGKRMSYQDAKDEQKEAEGTPEMKARRLEIARSRSGTATREGVKEATVVVVNPTHYAVALAYQGDVGGLPVCTAKGTDHLALQIRRFAQEEGIPIYSDAPLARRLHADLDVGAAIEEQHYRPVAAAIRFAQRISRYKRAARES